MKSAIKCSALVMLVAASLGLGGCVYYPVRSGVAYDGGNGNAVVDYDDSYHGDYYAAPGYEGYYYGPYSYGPGWYGWGYPAVSLGFYGSYWHGHGYRGPGRDHGGGWSTGPGNRSHMSTPPSRGTRH